jgi:hypothetical protein
MRIELLRASIIVALLGVAPSLALAQFMPGQMGGAGGPFGGTKAPPPAPKVAPPPALPGAASTGGGVPANHAPTDMEPTEALFDAINRGDITTARDAISRGADLHGHNVLGMTPLELSVDLGRNDISFMLLSMRAADDGRPPQASAAPIATKPPPSKQARRAPPHPAAKATASAPAPAQTARLFSGDGGAPNPNAGFLGFDSSRR